ncbi:hypothetical protein XACM_1680 [Xanthomonas euvesicatoria pv. citrumelo F1]|nr:hypothetical protein XACM_1680 [Xanthomonas euvesicatoria pv. citrumelo F1]
MLMVQNELCLTLKCEWDGTLGSYHRHSAGEK